MRTYFNSCSRLAARTLEYCLVIILGVLVCVVTWQVVSRYLLGAPDQFSEEIARICLMWFGLLGGAYAVYTKVHVGFSLIASRLPEKLKETNYLVVRGAVVVFAIVALFYGGGSLVWMTWSLQQKTAALGIPTALTYLVIPMSGLLIALFAIAPKQLEEREA